MPGPSSEPAADVRSAAAAGPGDPIELYSPYRRYLYEVTRVFVVTPDRVDVIAHTDEPQLTLTACHPPYSARYRIIAQAKLVNVRRLATPSGS